MNDNPTITDMIAELHAEAEAGIGSLNLNLTREAHADEKATQYEWNIEGSYRTILDEIKRLKRSLAADARDLARGEITSERYALSVEVQRERAASSIAVQFEIIDALSDKLNSIGVDRLLSLTLEPTA